MKMMQSSGKIAHPLRLEELLLLKWQSTDLM